MPVADSEKRALDWLAQLLANYFDSIENPQIDPNTYYSKGAAWISYGAFLYAHAAAIRGNGIYNIDVPHLEKSHQILRDQLASPNATAKAWARSVDHKGAELQELPWQVWENGLFEEMESKAAMPNKAWEWHDVRFLVEDLHKLFPAPNIYTMGTTIDVLANSDGELELCEAITLLSLGKAVSSAELSKSLWGPTNGIDFPPVTVRARETLLNACRSGSVSVYGFRSNGLGFDQKPIIEGANQVVPQTAFSEYRKYLLVSNTLNPRGGSNAYEPEFSGLTIKASDLLPFMLESEGRSSKAPISDESRNRRTLEKRVFRMAEDIVLSHPKQWSLRYKDIFAVVDFGDEQLSDKGYGRIQEKLGQRFPGLTKRGPKPRSEPKDWQRWV